MDKLVAFSILCLCLCVVYAKGKRDEHVKTPPAPDNGISHTRSSFVGDIYPHSDSNHYRGDTELHIAALELPDMDELTSPFMDERANIAALRWTDIH